MTRCKQCHAEGHHKMSCTDESNPCRKDRTNVTMSLKEPIVEGAYYEREDGRVCGYDLRCRVYIVPTDPAEVVAELRRRSAECEPPGEEVYGEEDNFQSGRSIGFDDSADLVESMLGLARCGEGCDGNCELTAPGPTKAEVELAELRSAAAKIVAELRRRERLAIDTDSFSDRASGQLDGQEMAYRAAADLVAEKLGVES